MISVANYESSIKQVDLSSLPKVFQEGHDFFTEAKDWYEKDKTVKESIDLYLTRLNEHLNRERRRSKTDQDQSFINRFVKLNNKIITREEIGKFIQSLQRAIIKKQIRRSSFYAQHIEKIQVKLIAQYNRLVDGEKIRIQIGKDWLEKLTSSNSVTSLDGIPDTSANIRAPKKLSIFESMDHIQSGLSEDSFRLQGDLGKLLGDLERFELAITLEGDQGGGKTRFGYQLANAFAQLGNQIAVFSLEIGKRSDLIRRMREEYVDPANRSKIFITDQLPDGFETIRKAAKQFDVVVIDSWNKLNVHSSQFDKLRKDFPNTIFIVIFQRTTQGTIRGGTAPLFDAGINLEVVKVDDTFRNNYAIATKNRYGETGLQYSIHSRQLNQEFIEEEHEEHNEGT
ncbi:MAG: antirestriction protein [Bacteroidota bacterium]